MDSIIAARNVLLLLTVRVSGINQSLLTAAGLSIASSQKRGLLKGRRAPQRLAKAPETLSYFFNGHYCSSHGARAEMLGP